MAQRQIRIAIIGAGSIGSLFGGYLAKNKSDQYQTEMFFFGRKEHIKMINENGLFLRKNDDISKITGIKGFTNPREYLEEKGQKDVHFCFLTTKTYDIESTLKEFEEIVENTKWFVILQNGIGNEELVKEYVPKSKIIRAITSNGAFLAEPGLIEHTGEGFTKMGLAFHKNGNENRGEDVASKAMKTLRDILIENGIEATISEDIIKACWEKIFVNIGINPFGALTRLRNGKLLKNKGIKLMMGEAVKEAVKVANHRGMDFSAEDFIELTYSVARKTENNINSMLQDILKGKQTEIDFINGKIVQYAEEMGISVPINMTLTHLIKGLEKSTL